MVLIVTRIQIDEGCLGREYEEVMIMQDKMIWARRTRGLSWCWGERMETTPVRWSSSERPLSVRTVWVKGVRHAILSTDDPLVQYSGQPCYQRMDSLSGISGSETSSVSENELEGCLVKLRVALDSTDQAILPAVENSSNRSSCDPSPCSSPTLSVLPQNPLSERVLQWLNLANKGHTRTATLLPKRPRNISSNGIKLSPPKRKIFSRSATVDVTSQISQRKTSVVIKTTKESPEPQPLLPVPFQEEQVCQPEIQSPLIVPQRYEPIRPHTAWPSSATKPSRPQLHIFIPPLEQLGKNAESSSYGT